MFKNHEYVATLLAVMVFFMVVCCMFAAFCPTQIAEAQAMLAPLQDAMQIIPTPAQ